MEALRELFDDVEPELVTNLDTSMSVAAEVLIDRLFIDLENHYFGDDIGVAQALNDLPDQWWPKLTTLVIRKLIVSAASLTHQLAGEWRGPDCLADEVLFHILIDYTEESAEVRDLALPDDWQSTLRDGFLDDTDFLSLYDDKPANLNGTAAGAVLGTSSTAFEDLFTPFAEKVLSPYLV